MQKSDTVKNRTQTVECRRGRQACGARCQGRRFPALVELQLLVYAPLIVSFSAAVLVSGSSPAPIEVSAAPNVRTSVEMEAVLLGMIQSGRVLWEDLPCTVNNVLDQTRLIMFRGTPPPRRRLCSFERSPQDRLHNV